MWIKTLVYESTVCFGIWNINIVRIKSLEIMNIMTRGRLFLYTYLQKN